MSVTIATPTVAATDFIASQLASFSQPSQALEGIAVNVAVADETQPRPTAGVSFARPHITIRPLAAVDRWFIGGFRGVTQVIVEVTAWDEGVGVTRLRPIVAAMFAALNRTSGTAGQVRVTACIRTAAIERQVREDDRIYTQLGAEFRLRLMQP